MLLYRTILLMLGAGALIVGILLVFMLAMSWSTAERAKPLAGHLGYLTEVQRVYETIAEAPPAGEAARNALAKAVGSLQRLADNPAARVPGSGDALLEAAAAVEDAAAGTDLETIPSALAALRETLTREQAAHWRLLGEIQEQNRRELHAALALGIVLPVFALAFLVFFHGRVLSPLNDLSYLLGLLARKEYTVAATDNVDPLVRPLFEKYNRMVKRMHGLEQGHLKRESSLKEEVDQTSRALFQQLAAMARMERMAAVGEVAARLSHELRNPLSGVLMALTNLRAETESEDQDERLALAIGELERIAHLLTSIVEESRQVPERPRWIELKTLVDEMIALLRYRLDEHIDVRAEVPKSLRCRLPESGLRHALLNLVLNAAGAIGERPGTIRISATEDGDRIAITVSDDGPGFPEELLQGGVHDYGSWRKGGTGLGLATVRRFAFASSGKLLLENLSSGGARVTLLFPLEECNG